MLLGFSVLLAILSYFIKNSRSFLAGTAMLINGLATGVLFGYNPSVWSLIAAVFGFYQLFNLGRLVKSRLHSRHLKLAFYVGGLRLLALQILFVGLANLSSWSTQLEEYSILVLRVAQVSVAFLIMLAVVYRLYKSRPKNSTNFFSDTELPSISVLIPARFEDRELEEILHGIVANDYPKMEVIVLDDQSNSPRISEIVKGFAQKGVRFVEGGEIKENWLAKNQAYDVLASSASGEYLVFMGVDVRLGVDAIRSAVTYAKNNSVDMISILPSRFDGSFWQGFFSPLRYFRELIRPGFRLGGAPALSTMWLIRRDAYDSLGGMPAVARKVIPEQYFARQLNRQKKYAFVRTNSKMHISTAKTLKEQLATSKRVIYPSQHRRMEINAITNIAMLVFLFTPFLQLPHALYFGEWHNAILSGLAVLFLAISHMAIVTLTNPILWPMAVVNFPYLVLQEVVLSFSSMYSYEFGEVYWKGRTISQPVMQVIPHLPKIE